MEYTNFNLIAALADEEIRRDTRTKIQRLTKRELEILHFIVMGVPNKIIAYKLGISQRTVENHRIKIIEKTNCNSPSSLTILFLTSVKECLPYCIHNGRCNNAYNNCHIEKHLL